MSNPSSASREAYPSTITLRPSEVPEAHRVKIDMRKFQPFITTAKNSNTHIWNLTLELPVEANIWHKVCAKRAGITGIPWTIDRDVSCHGCHRKIARKSPNV